MKEKSLYQRLGIFVFFDPEGIVDDYVLYMLEKLKENMEHLIIISNCQLDEENKHKLEKYSSDIITRKNEGLDAGALHEYFTTREEYKNYDEVICFNDTFFGPLYSFKEIFQEMEKKQIDFWGLTEGHIQPDGYNQFKNGIPAHIQTFFIVFRKNVLNSKCFLDYWKKYSLKQMQTFHDVVTKHEITFTKYLVEHGFSYDVYVKDENISRNYNRNYNNYAYNTSTQIIKNHAPFIKRKSIVQNRKDTMYLTDKNDIKESLEYIKTNTDYNTKMIWQNILRKYNIHDIKESVNLYRIIKGIEKEEECEIIVYIDNKNHLDLLRSYLSNISKKYYLYTANIETFELLNNDFLIKKIEENMWSTELKKVVKNIQTEYIGYIYIAKEDEKITIISESVTENLLSNTVQNDKYINGLINELKNDNNIGCAMVPNNYHFDYFFLNLIWKPEDYERVKKYLSSYRQLSLEKAPITYSNAWFVKKELLDSLDFSAWEIKDNEDFSNLLTIMLPYFCATKKHYPLIVISEENATNHLTYLEDIYEKTYQEIYLKNPRKYTYLETLNKIKTDMKFKEEKRTLKKGINKVRRMYGERRNKKH